MLGEYFATEHTEDAEKGKFKRFWPDLKGLRCYTLHQEPVATGGV